MELRYIAIYLLLLLPIWVSANELVDTKIDWFNIKAIKIKKNTGYKLIVWVSEKGESLESMVKRYGWVSWVNWAYFCPKDYKECWGVNKSYADRISNWVDYSFSPDDTWPERVIFALDKDQNPFLFRKAHDYSRWRDDEFIQGKTLNFNRRKDIFNWIWNHPLLLQDGVDKVWECKIIDSKMKKKALKNFVCSDESWENIYLWWVENASIYELPWIIKKFWCYNAIGLDNWWSSAMIHNGKYLRWPWRDITDAWIVIPDKNYPVEPDFSKDPATQRAIEDFKRLLEAKYSVLDDMTRKQKYFALSSKLEIIISKLKAWSKKRVYYEWIKRFVDSMIM